ncbi:MAG: ABC transporter permease [Solirubrobacteraceae bacterium]
MPAERTALTRALDVLRARTFMFALVLAVALFVANLIVQSSFVSSGGLPETLADLAPFAIVAMASAPSILIGGLDLSVGPVLSLTNVVMVAVLLPHGLGNPATSIPILLALGAFVGALSGALISYLRLPAIIVGLGALFIVTGVGQQILLTPEQAGSNWTDHLGGKFGPVPGGLVTIVVPLLVWLALKRTPFVKAMFSIGGDAPTAFASGMNVGAIRIVAYALGGMFAAIAGLALTGLIRSADSSLGLQYTLIAIAAVSLGGTPVGGGRGGLVGALIGAACIYLIQNLLSGLNISALYLDVVYGCVLIAAVILSSQLAPRRLGGPAR